MPRRSTETTAPRTALVLGGNSDIARATMRRLASTTAQAGLDRVVLAVRDPAATRARLDAEPLPIADIVVEQWDALDAAAHRSLLRRSAAALGSIDLILCAVGRLGHGAGIGAKPSEAAELITANFTAPATAITAAAHHLVEQGHGCLVVITSVAGLRARRSNYIYGSAKAGLDTFAQGLADSLVKTDVRVHIVRPGFVHTKMTTGLKAAPFSTDADTVAEAIAAAVVERRSSIVHVPGALSPLFKLLRVLPRPLWRRVAGNR
jgi:decaprenylphospho-beta-D-erythro-pentofuranosid-2-ulose 2-reductase